MNSYEISRAFFDFSYKNPEKIKPGHSAIYFFALDCWNRMGWKAKFGFPTDRAMEAIGIKKYQTYIAYLNDLIEWGFITMIERSKNQYTANVISINNAMPENGKAQGKALDKATAFYARKRQSTGQSEGESIGQSEDSIDKLRTNNKESSTHTLEEVNQWERFQAWVNEHTPRVNQMQKPLTIAQYLNLQQKFEKNILTSALEGMENWADLKKRVSANLTIQTFIRNQKPVTNHAATTTASHTDYFKKEFDKAARAKEYVGW